MTDAIEQMLGYLTWRDYKCALVVFNKENAGFTEIQDKVPGLVKGLKNFQKQIDNQPAGEWKFIVTSGDDESKSLTMQVFIFNLYCK